MNLNGNLSLFTTMNRPTPRTVAFRLLALCAIFAPILPVHLNDDNGYWHGMASDLLNYGRWPFLQYWDHSFPGPLLVHLPVMYLFGPSDIAFRTADILIQLSFCWVLYRLWRLWLTDRMAWLAVLLYAFYYARGTPALGGEKDVYGMILVFCASYIILNWWKNRSPANFRLWIDGRVLGAAGLLVGLAVLIKPMYLIYLLPLVVFIPELRGFLQIAILFTCGLLPLFASFGIFALQPGGLDAYWTATVTFNRDLYATISRPFSRILKWLTSPKVFAIPLVAGIIALISGRRIQFGKPPLKAERAIYFAFLTFAFAIILLQRKFYAYHFVMIVVLLTPVAAHGVESILESAVVKRLKFGSVAMVLMFTFLWILSLQYETFYNYFHNRRGSDRVTETLRASFNFLSWPDSSAAPTLAYFSKPERLHSTVEVCSFDPRLRFYLARRVVGKYPTLEAMGYRTDSTDPHAFTSYQRVWRREYMDTLRFIRPEYMIISRLGSAEYLQDPYADVLHYVEGFDSLMHANYHLDTTIGTNEIYRLSQK